jgi:DNA primase
MAARTHRRPLVLVEGPADVVALMQRAPRDLDVVALIGTANVLSTAALREVPGVVLALDDGGGPKGRARCGPRWR